MAVFAMATVCDAQKVTLKTNAPIWALGGANLGVEFAIAPKWTLGVEGAATVFNPYDSYEAHGWMATGEVRYYTCKAFNGHHLGLYGNYGRFSELTVSDGLLSKFGCGGQTTFSADKVNITSVGLSYGYYFKLGTHWSIDTTIGAGMNYAGDRSDWAFGLGRVQVALGYRF